MSDLKKVRRVGSITLNDRPYDLAMNGEAMLAVEGLDLYDRPCARRVGLPEVAGADWPVLCLCQELLNQLAAVLIERDAALARLHKTGEEVK